MKRSTHLVPVLACAALALLVAVPTGARADLPQKAFRLHLESGLIMMQQGDIEWDDGPGDTDLDNFSAGLGIPRFGAGLGFVVWQGLVIGGRIETAFHDSDHGWLGYQDSFALAILPYVEYAFLTGIFRPFVTVYLGVQGLVNDLGDNDDFSMWAFATGGGGGGHIFLMDRFSIDLTLLLGVLAGHAEYDFGPGTNDGNYVLFDMAILFGLSGWI